MWQKSGNAKLYKKRALTGFTATNMGEELASQKLAIEKYYNENDLD